MLKFNKIKVLLIINSNKNISLFKKNNLINISQA